MTGRPEIRSLEGGGWTRGNLRRPGLAPRTIVDAGAHKGTLPLYQAFPECFFALVEPLAECSADLQSVLSWVDGIHLPVALGSQVGSVQLHVEPVLPPKSSILTRTPLTATGDRLIRREVPVTTLDGLLGEPWLNPPFGLKLDTEGYELEVVRGGAEFLRSTHFVIAEVSVADRFIDGYGFAEFIAEMDRLGFRAVDVLASRGRHADFLFVRTATTDAPLVDGGSS